MEASDIEGEAEKAGTAYSREEKAQGDLVNVYDYLTGRREARLLSAVSRHRTEGGGHK